MIVYIIFYTMIFFFFCLVAVERNCTAFYSISCPLALWCALALEGVHVKKLQIYTRGKLFFIFIFFLLLFAFSLFFPSQETRMFFFLPPLFFLSYIYMPNMQRRNHPPSASLVEATRVLLIRRRQSLLSNSESATGVADPQFHTAPSPKHS